MDLALLASLLLGFAFGIRGILRISVTQKR
jgi:hypothetical protein